MTLAAIKWLRMFVHRGPILRQRHRGWFYLLGAVTLGTLLPAQTSAPVTVTIDINSSVTTPVSSGFSGVSTDLGFPVEYWD
jgi:hypothetical protein